MANEIFDKYGKDPLEIFGKWLAEAEKAEISDPNAMALATADSRGRPSVRMVLLKAFDERGFVFFTNLDSQKGRDLQANPYAEVNFHWKSLEKQIRISGPAARTSEKESDDYFATRSVISQLGALASAQSRPLESYEIYARKVRALEKEFEGRTVPRPERWGGFRLKPERMEFWIGQRDRMHKRFSYTRNAAKGWDAAWIYP